MNKGQNLLPAPQRKLPAATGLAVTLVLLCLGAAMYFYGGLVLDAIKASQFTPSSALASASDRIDLTPRAQQIFYATAPQIEAKEQFNNSCKSTERTTAILGCYYLDRIYLYDIRNAELDGTLEVTAAHEMLHAAYQRLNYFDRQQVDSMVSQQYEAIKDQPEIKQLMAFYSQSEPGAELDELHSIIGTTIQNISPKLEQYYGRYFTNRPAVVALNAKYSAVFSELSKQADDLQKQIDAEGPAIKADMAAYDSDLSQLNFDVESFNARAQVVGGFTTQAEFNVARAGIIQRTSLLNARQNALNARISAYNTTVESLNKIAVHVSTLNQSINGVSAPSGVQ